MSQAPHSTNTEMLRHYIDVSEASRLSSGVFQIERARTEELILRHLPPAPLTIIDIGGGAGAYALWLARRGYTVHLLDAVPKHVAQAKAESTKQPQSPLASAQVGDARRLPFEDSSADAVLLLGPLYHLLQKENRLAALREAYRVLRPNGVIWGAGISRFASLFECLVNGFFAEPTFGPILEGDLKEGQHRNPTDNPRYFTDAFFHLPEELSGEVEEAGFQVIETVGIEGPGWLARDFDELWKDPSQRQRLLQIAREFERDPSVLATSAHLMIIARRPA